VNTKPEPSEAIPSAILAGGLLPFLAVIAWASMFDSQGGNGFVGTVVNLLLLSPVLLFFGFATGVFYYHSPMFRRFVWVIDSALVSVMFVGLVLIPSLSK
jgi:hypothetical protein